MRFNKGVVHSVKIPNVTLHSEGQTIQEIMLVTYSKVDHALLGQPMHLSACKAPQRVTSTSKSALAHVREPTSADRAVHSPARETIKIRAKLRLGKPVVAPCILTDSFTSVISNSSSIP